jgi:hypothetical protein
MNNFLQKGIAQIQEATTADQAGDYPTAINKYMQGLEYFNYAHKRERVRPAQQHPLGPPPPRLPPPPPGQQW